MVLNANAQHTTAICPKCIFIWSTLGTGHEHVTLWLLCHHCQRKVFSYTVLFICLPIYLFPCVPFCLSVHPISQQPIRPSDHVLALPDLSGLPACPPAWAVFRRFSCYTLCLHLHLFINFFYPFCFESNRNSSVSIVTRLSAGRVRNL